MRRPLRVLLIPAAAVLALLPPACVAAQGGGGSGGQAPPSPRQDSIRAAVRLDLDGRTVEARDRFTALLGSAADDLQRAQMHRAIAMTWAFEGNCAETVRHEEMVIAYWKTREQAEPQNAFYQQGEMANEAARVCIDLGDLETAERWYRTGRELGLREPEPKRNPASLWEYRTAHALARLAARRGRPAEARARVEEARAWLARDTVMALAQRRFLPYLEGYVAYYANDAVAAERHFTDALALQGNQNDPFFHFLLAATYAKAGKAEQAKATYRVAFEKATAHNPPSAYVRREARRILGL